MKPSIGAASERPALASVRVTDLQDRARLAVVDDDPSMRMSLEVLLSVAGFTVDTYASGEEYLASGSPPVGCLVLDVHLGGMSGTELREALRARGIDSPVVFITGKDDVATLSSLARAGISYLRKPFDPPVLLDRIRRAISRS